MPVLTKKLILLIVLVSIMFLVKTVGEEVLMSVLESALMRF